MCFHVPANQTVSYSVYSQAIGCESRLTHDFLAKHGARITRAFNAGEPIWMIVAELKMVHETTLTWVPTKTPRALAKRVTYV